MVGGTTSLRQPGESTSRSVDFGRLPASCGPVDASLRPPMFSSDKAYRSMSQVGIGAHFPSNRLAALNHSNRMALRLSVRGIQGISTGYRVSLRRRIDVIREENLPELPHAIG